MRTIGGTAAILLLTVVSMPAKAALPQHLTMTVRVVNSPISVVKTLAQAKRLVGEIFERVGVEIVWQDCPTETVCQTEPGAGSFRLEILDTKQPPRYGDRTGFAVLSRDRTDGESYAAVLYPMVEAAAADQGVKVAEVLAATMAHELGHLLLGAGSHRTRGVMSPRLGHQQLRLAARGELLFTPEQATAIRAQLARRMAQQ
ncbi:MAG TPA: hypothetical protein VKU19_15330 [Bryobacteraceae bacterium]|nr:hypothetical protein [Bryobacteraceae bacterium]